jgi:hypothetical protein
MNTEAKLCPLFFPGGYDDALCKGEKCSWFVDGQCSIVVIARFLSNFNRELETLV